MYLFDYPAIKKQSIFWVYVIIARAQAKGLISYV
jgi:hypothetical protein